jgi:hypothetical protein
VAAGAWAEAGASAATAWGQAAAAPWDEAGSDAGWGGFDDDLT